MLVSEQQQQQEARDGPVHRRPQDNGSAQPSDYYGYPMVSHDHTQRLQYDVFTQNQHLPVMTIHPLPIVHSSNAGHHQEAFVSIEEEIFEARMIQEALHDYDTTSIAATQPDHYQYSTSFFFQQQPFETHIVTFSSQLDTLPAPSEGPRRSSLSQADNRGKPMLQRQHHQPITVVMGPVNDQSHTLLSFSSSSDKNSATTTKRAWPRKRVQTARICQIDGCTRGIRSRGLCKAHGGGRRCTTPGCTTSDQGGGHCVLHGGGRRCIVDGCMKSAQWRGVCKLHGGARRCRYGGCIKNGQVKQGYCRLHYNLVARQRLESLLVKVGQQEGQVEADSESKEQLGGYENDKSFTL